MTRHYPDRDSASDWLKLISQGNQPVVASRSVGYFLRLAGPHLQEDLNLPEVGLIGCGLDLLQPETTSIFPMYYVVLFSYSLTLPIPVQGGIILGGLMNSLLLGGELGGGLSLGPSLENIAILASLIGNLLFLNDPGKLYYTTSK